MATRVLYKAADGSWRAAEPRAYIRRLYTLRQGERWTLLDRDRALVVHTRDHPRSYIPMGAWRGLPHQEGRTRSAKKT
ncbi:MAG: hypothetical protein QOD29_3625, partial [Alphaproteobacteria bacterium]|nr:hypothetical protein [Alphaproteobacteria bacterium]